MNRRRIPGICAGLLLCGAASAAGGGEGGRAGAPAPGLNLSLPGNPDAGRRLEPPAPTAAPRSAFDARMPDGYQASPICRNGVRSTSYQMVDGRMVYRCD